MKKKIFVLVLLAVLLTPVLALNAANNNLDLWGGTQDDVSGALGLGTKDIRTTIASIINVAMGLLGIVAVVLILYGGFTWMLAGGTPDKVEKAKKIIGYGVIGLVIILCAYAIATFVINSLMTATS